MNYVECHTQERLPEERDSVGAVLAKDTAVLNVSLMLPPGISADEVDAMLSDLFNRDERVLYWRTNMVRRAS